MIRPDPPFADLLLDERSKIFDAMVLLNRSGREVVLVTSATGSVVGLITDGDIRRGVVAGAPLDSPVTAVMNTQFTSVSPALDRATALDIMKTRTIQHLPVLNEDGRLMGVHFLRDLIVASRKPNIAVIMAGGKGTRLRPITDAIPKPMVEVAGRPILERIVLHLVGTGITEIYLAVNYMAELIEAHFRDGAEFGCRISYLRESLPLGTGGALSLLPRMPDHPFLVLNGDQLTRIDFEAMLDQHTRTGDLATIAVGRHAVRLPYAVLREAEGKIAAIDEKPTVHFLVNRGIYVLSPFVLEHVPCDAEFHITSLFEALLAKGHTIGAFNFDDYWLDVTQPADLGRANGFS